MSTETERILCLLERRFPAPEWASFRELPDGTGSAMRRRLDFYALNTWPSKGFRSVAVEVKISRADFRRELAHREKRQPAEQRANECYFAVPHGLVKVDEVPEGWGLFTADAGGLRLRKNAQWREMEHLPRAFVAQLARSGPAAPDAGSKKLWSYVGRELTRDDLLAIAEAEALSSVYALQRKIRDEAIEAERAAVASSYEQRRLIDLSQAVREAIGGWSPTAQSFKQWAASAGGMPAGLIKALHNAHTAIGSAIELHSAQDAARDDTGE